MSESVIVAIISAISTLIAASITGFAVWYIAIRKTPKELKVLDAQGALDITGSFKNYAEGLDVIIRSVMTTNKDLETRVNELEAHRTERGRQIYDLQQTIADMKHLEEVRDREYVKETQSLRDEIAQVKKSNAEYEKKNAEYKMIIEQLLDVLQKVDPKLVDGIALTDTLKKIQAIK